MLSLPTDPILKITSYLSLTNLKAFSRTSHQIRNRCGMLKLNELYGVSLEAFKKLQADFEFKSCWSRELSSEEMLNIYLARLSNYHPSIKENITMEMAPSITNPFAPIVTRFTLCQAFDDSFLLTEDIKPLISNLSSNQFIAAIRLGKSIAYVEVPKDNFFLKHSITDM
ncbi:MAG TPA: hypothetical protein PLC42_02965 [Parachlamydiaceae bacterium]|nr:hypothetical protein [Parachlamydiaceae bacterium]